MPTTKVLVKQEEESYSPETKVALMNAELKHVNQTMSRIESKFDAAIANFVTNEKLESAQRLADQKHEDQDRAIKKLEDWNTWAVRIVLGAVILAAMSLVLISK